MALVRLFQRHELDPEQKLEKGLLRRGISTMRQLLFQPERDMARAMDLSITAYRRLLEKLCTILSPVHITAYDLVHTSAKTVQALPTGILSLDRALKGGIACGNLTEIAGVAGVGKTQFCMLLSISSICKSMDMDIIDDPSSSSSSSNSSSVLYFDTEHKFSSLRFAQMLRHQCIGMPEENITRALQRLYILRIASSEKLLQKFQSLHEFVQRERVRLIIVDSIATLVRKDYGPQEMYRRHEMLMLQANVLKELAGAFSIPIVMTNQATQFSDALTCQPVLGNSWFHSVNTRRYPKIVLEKAQTFEQEERRLMTIVKSPVTGRLHIPFVIQNKGLVEIQTMEDERPVVENHHDLHQISILEAEAEHQRIPKPEPLASERSTPTKKSKISNDMMSSEENVEDDEDDFVAPSGDEDPSYYD